MPLFLRISGTDWLEESLPNEPSWRIEDTVRLAPILAAHGVDFYDISSGGGHPAQKMNTLGAYQAHLSEAVKKAAGDKILVGAAKAKAAAPTSSSGGKAAKKKKWSKGKVKDKAQHAVMIDKPTYDRILKEVPTFRFISQSILIERLKVNGSLARVAIRHLEKEGQIKRIIHHHGQLIYTRSTTSSD
ncbi:hypothetical protein EWM64_g9297 [Hericium alpestre]|uniref:40S ribosomal protein S25 n=1 Tax=Hericium alpestre TaxID=135208 RepID=A0A4Y9ZJE8_9AGAM|nr:hypothetical protein EWM64_g9297 [Hericium alpestre]